MPFVIASLPALGLSFLADESFHQWMAVACFVIAFAAFVPGWRKHRRLVPAGVGLAGLTLIGGAAFGLSSECCASCHVVATVDEPAPVCNEVCCEHCTTETDTALPDATTETRSPSLASIAPQPTNAFLSIVAPWLTPVGGLILVVAHLLNRRFGCLCGCCENQPSEGLGREMV
ncbi:MAG: MerC domain-containing protein [Pirellulales bacterium]|nr:MerC domain-containing protein [Pirellulales bacterium]